MTLTLSPKTKTLLLDTLESAKLDYEETCQAIAEGLPERTGILKL